MKKGDIIEFGEYVQDYDIFVATPTRTPIEWIVLDVNENENEVLLISRYGLDDFPYHRETTQPITWEDCMLRQWLNDYFIKCAFSEEEITNIKVSELKNDDHRRKEGKNTKDRVFCLSINEVEQYFNSDDERKCKPTPYARIHGAYFLNGSCFWWLRSPGTSTEVPRGASTMLSHVYWDGRSTVRAYTYPDNYAAFVNCDGSLSQDGKYASYHSIVRPALRISLDECERRHREVQERKRRQLEDQERKEREEQERKKREEQERKECEEQERKQLKQAYKDFLEIIKKGIKKGMIIPFGSYPQDKKGYRAPIEWLVLDVKKPSFLRRLCFGDKTEVLLISRYGLDCKQYHYKTFDRITWEDCELRQWLNNDFIKSAFSEEETKRITVSELKNDEKYGTRGGNDTKDRVFCLSIDEAEQYFNCDNDRQCQPTAYARNHGAYVYNGSCYWWLRSPDRRQDDVAFVAADGSLCLDCYCVYRDRFAVRPALRIICNL